MIQYNHIIYSASATFLWDNVYAYNHDFRMHLSEHPDRNWGIILQQAWTMRMVERINSDHVTTGKFSPGTTLSGSGGPSSNPGKKLCYKYNRGKCTYGFNCKFEHKCGICAKYGHGAHICRKGLGKEGKDESYQRQDNKKSNGDFPRGKKQ